RIAFTSTATALGFVVTLEISAREAQSLRHVLQACLVPLLSEDGTEPILKPFVILVLESTVCLSVVSIEADLKHNPRSLTLQIGVLTNATIRPVDRTSPPLQILWSRSVRHCLVVALRRLLLRLRRSTKIAWPTDRAMNLLVALITEKAVIAFAVCYFLAASVAHVVCCTLM